MNTLISHYISLRSDLVQAQIANPEDHIIEDDIRALDMSYEDLMVDVQHLSDLIKRTKESLINKQSQ